MDEAITFWVNWDIWLESLLVVIISASTLGYLGIWVTLKKVTYVPLAISQVAAVGVVIAFLLHEFFRAHDPGEEGLLILLEPAWFSFLLSVTAAFFFARPGIGGDRPVVITYLVAGATALILGGFTRQDVHDVRSILFGHAVLAELDQVILVAAAAFAVVTVHLVYYRRFLYVSFDPDAAGAASLPVYGTEVILYMTLAVMLSAATRAMGAMPAFGLTVIPALAGLQVGGSMRRAIIVSVGVSICSAFFGYYLSFVLDLSTGASMLALAALLLLITWVISTINR